jgi:hypothetical protein
MHSLIVGFLKNKVAFNNFVYTFSVKKNREYLLVVLLVVILVSSAFLASLFVAAGFQASLEKPDAQDARVKIIQMPKK